VSPEADQDALLAEAQAGNVRAFERLVRTHLPRVRRFARAFARSEADADDLAQEALVRAYKRIRSFRYQSAFQSWLYAVVRNAFLDVTKSRAARERRLEQPLGPGEHPFPSGQPGPDEALLEKEERERLWSALRRVPVEFRTALVLFDLEGHSYDEVAAVEGVPVGTVKSRLSRGRAALRQILGSAEGAPRASPGVMETPLPGTLQPGGSSQAQRSRS